MRTTPVGLYDHMETSDGCDRGTFSPVRAIQHLLRYGKYAVAGALGAMAIVETAGQVWSFGVDNPTLIVGGSVGAGLMVIAARAVRLL